MRGIELSKSKLSLSFNAFIYRFNQSEVFTDFLDYILLVTKWWDPNRDFSYFENKYGDLYPQFSDMFTLVSEVSDSAGDGCTDALGDLFMELVSGGRNGQYFTPENMSDMLAAFIAEKVEDDQSVIDPTCGSGRMLLAAAKRNRNAFFFGCDNDITCCKMAVINLILNTLQGEIALMDTLAMKYTKSWEVSYRNWNGINMPVYRVVEDQNDSNLWQMHINTFMSKEPERTKEAVVEFTEPIYERPIVLPAKTAKKKANTLQLELF